jgi:hypothetical protein
MPIPYIERPLPAAFTPDDPAVGHLLARVRAQEIPGFLVLDGGGSVDEMTAGMGPALAALDGRVDDLMNIDIRIGDPTAHPEDRSDRGLHLDASPNRQARRLSLNLHWTEFGEATVQLVSPGPQFLAMRDASPDPHATGPVAMPAGTLELFAEGKVDPRVLSPDVYVGSLAARSLVVFTLFGPNPTAHNFISHTARRTSHLRIASVPLLRSPAA